MTPNDPLFAQSWHFPMIGDIARIWDDYSGQGVSVGVYDDGIQVNHPDLNDNYDASLHFSYGGTVYLPTPLNRDANHGTACAGLIAGEANNGRGSVGVAWGTSITGVNFLDDLQYETEEIYAAALLHMAAFDITSNSYGWQRVVFTSDQNVNVSGSFAAIDVAMYEQVVAIGRGGLGTIIVKAAGNDTLNSSGDGTNSSRHTITVAAIENGGMITDYSNWGPSILVSAPAAGVTTDRTGDRGYNTTSPDDGDAVHADYTSNFNGTSAATPVVAGVVALMLEANPGLGWRDVQTILALSAAHTGSAYGGPGAGFEIGQWGSGTQGNWNGGGNTFHYSYGFGMVDAFAAVRMAEAWSLISPVARTSANELREVLDYAGNPVGIPDAFEDPTDGVTAGLRRITLVETDDIEIETIYVTVDVTHSYAPDLVIWLVAPDGLSIPVFYNEGGEYTMDGGLRWTFGVDALRGYSSLGTWRVEFEDTATLDRGRVNDVTIEFFGAAASDDDIHTFTDDYLMLAAVEGWRRSVFDEDGGNDWINMAAIAGDVAGSMGMGQAIRVDGARWFGIKGTADGFENIHLGDGDDVVSGNTLANAMIGGRGNDRLSGLGANDSLTGGDGNDTLNGGAGDDRLEGGRGADLLLGGLNADTFVFGADFGIDRVQAFQNNVDTLELDDALWTGVKTVAQVLADHAAATAGGVVLTFGANVLTLANLTSVGVLADDIVIV